MHLHTSLISPPCSKACGFSTQLQCRAYVLVARSSNGKRAEDHKLYATNHTAQTADHVTVAAPGCTTPAAATAADAVASQQPAARRRRRNSSKVAVQAPGALHTITPSIAVGAAADAAAQAAASKALQLYPYMAAAFIRRSTTQGLRGTGVSTARKNKWTVVLSRGIHGRKVTFRRSYGSAVHSHSCLVAAAAADLAHLAVYGHNKISDAQLPSILGDGLGRPRPPMTANLPLALYDDKDIQTWRALLQLEQPDITVHAVTLPVTYAAAQPQLRDAAPLGQREELHTQKLPQSSQTAVQHQQQMMQQQNSTGDVPTVATGVRKPPATPLEQQQRRHVRAAASAAVATAVQRVRQHAEERPGTVENSLWAFEENPEPPEGSCVSLRRGRYSSPWKARVSLRGDIKWSKEVSKYFKSPLEAAVAADLARLALHGRRQPSSSGCKWNFPIGLYTDEQIHAFGRLIQQSKPFVVLSGMQ